MTRTNPWLVCILPLAMFTLLTSFEPKPGVGGQGSGIGGQAIVNTPASDAAPAPAPGWFDIPYAWYPLVYTLKMALVALTLWFVWPGIRQVAAPPDADPRPPPPDPPSLSWLPLAVGVVGAGVWIGLCELDLERTWLPHLGLGWMMDLGQRSGFDPLVELADRPAWAYGFLAIRLLGLAVIVPISEELFLRGFAARFIDDPDHWPTLPIGPFTWTSAVATTGLAMLSHTGELLAAAVWFSLVSVMVWRTRRLWDAVAAHAVTNLLLGVYVVQSGAWRLL